MALRETENNAFARFLGTNKEHYGMLWIFWSGQLKTLFSSLEVMSRAVHDICRPQIADYKSNDTKGVVISNFTPFPGFQEE